MEAHMLLEYCERALQRAEYKKLEDGSWYAEIPGFEGVWANGATVENCRKELREVLEEWLLLKIRDNDPIPSLNGFETHSMTRWQAPAIHLSICA
jgi:predicted RNase H-like HicB family nuclease